MNIQEKRWLREFLAAPHLSGFRQIVSPEHPLIFRGPDAVLSAPHNICALFLPNTLERKNPAHLASRLIATRLAYPAETRCVLVPGGGELDSDLQNDFDVSLQPSGQELIDFIRTPEETGKPPAPAAFRQNMIERFDRALRTSLLSYRLQRFEGRRLVAEGKRPIGRTPDFVSNSNIDFRQDTIRQRDRYLFHDVPLVIAAGRSPDALLRRTKSTAELQFIFDYGLDNGALYSKRDSQVALLVVNNWSSLFDESSKAVTAAAFAGIALAPAADPEELERFVAKARTIRRPSENTFDNLVGDD
jgi:hypothetical protein